MSNVVNRNLLTFVLLHKALCVFGGTKGSTRSVTTPNTGHWTMYTSVRSVPPIVTDMAYAWMVCTVDVTVDMGDIPATRLVPIAIS